MVLTKGWTSRAPKILNKIWMERSWDKKLLQIRNEIWTKNQRTSMSLNSLGNSLENLGTFDVDEIWPASALLHLIARKNQFLSKEDRKFEFHSKLEFGFISR
jgi:hypothetical protein